MTVLHVERRHLDPSHRPAFDLAVRELIDAMRDAPGFLWADASVSVDDDVMVTLLGEWRTAADLDAFLSGDRYRELSIGLDAHERGPAGVRRFHGDAGAE